MSSIDKGIEQTVRRTGRNIRITRRGNYIVGLIKGEQIFSIKDRYGYINESEIAEINNGIKNYDKAVKERQERENKETYRLLNNNIANKKNEIKNEINSKKNLFDDSNNHLKIIKNKLDNIQNMMPILDISILIDEHNQMINGLEKEKASFLQKSQKLNKEILDISNSVKENDKIDNYNTLNNKCSKLNSRIDVNISLYDIEKIQKKIEEINNAITSIVIIKQNINELSKFNDETLVITEEVTARLKEIKVTSLDDIKKIFQLLKNATDKVESVITNSQNKDDIKNLDKLFNSLKNLDNIINISINSTYKIKDYRDDIVRKTQEVIYGFEQLKQQEFTTCSMLRINQVLNRCSRILTENIVGQDVLEELINLKNELYSINNLDNLHKNEYMDYCTIVNDLISYGISKENIPNFNANDYAKQKRELAIMLNNAIRESEKSNMIITDLKARSVMEKMGYELFYKVGDKDDYIIESLYTKKGYDGVLWQIITLSDGSISRRIIGVNKGTTQTDLQSIKEVAHEMETLHEPEKFLQEYNEAVGGGITVTNAVDYNSVDSDQVIITNGYHYLNSDALKLYEEKVKDSSTKKTTISQKVKARQVVTTAQNTIRSTTNNLQNLARRSQNVSHAH